MSTGEIGEILLLGTAHVSQTSVDEVRDAIEHERPDCVCVELDSRRLEMLKEGQRFGALDLREVIKRRQLAALATSLVLTSYQRRLGEQMGVAPGSELLEAVRGAEAAGIPVVLADRDIGITMRRAWGLMPFGSRLRFLAALMSTLFEREGISEEKLQELRSSDVLSDVMRELGEAFPALKRVLIDERDTYLAEQVRRAPGVKRLAVVGAGHVDGIARALRSATAVDLEPILAIPPPRRALRWLGWAVPLFIVVGLIAIAFRQGPQAAGDGALFWILANGIPAGLGAALARAHPLTILSAFGAAPLTSLTPLIGAGYVSAFAESWLRPPRVDELRSAPDDAGTLGAWWRNRLLRVVSVFLMTTLGSLLGTVLGAADIATRLVRSAGLPGSP